MCDVTNTGKQLCSPNELIAVVLEKGFFFFFKKYLQLEICNFVDRFMPKHTHIYNYIYAFSRCFYPKRLTVHSGYTFFFFFFFFLVHVFSGNRTHNLCAANAML